MVEIGEFFVICMLMEVWILLEYFLIKVIFLVGYLDI